MSPKSPKPTVRWRRALVALSLGLVLAGAAIRATEPLAGLTARLWRLIPFGSIWSIAEREARFSPAALIFAGLGLLLLLILGLASIHWSSAARSVVRYLKRTAAAVVRFFAAAFYATDQFDSLIEPERPLAADERDELGFSVVAVKTEWTSVFIVNNIVGPGRKSRRARGDRVPSD